MLDFYCIKTGSSGNSYLLSNGQETLILDLGITYKELLLNLTDFNAINGCLVSHFHGDHANKQALKELSAIGLTILSPKNANIGKKYKLGAFDVIPLSAIHNIECMSYLINSSDQWILFSTDTQALPKVANVQIDHFIVECNYDERLREKEILNSRGDTLHLQGIYQNHHSLQNAIAYFKELPYKPKSIVAIHKSNSGLLDCDTALNELSVFADKVYVAEEKKGYQL